jgi:hypothetical protein
VNAFCASLRPLSAGRPRRRLAAWFFPVALAIWAGEASAQANEQPDIIVTAPALRFEAPPERSIGHDEIAAFGRDTVGEVLAEVAIQEGDAEEPAYFVNGRRVEGLGSVSELPAEAIVQVEVLPRGAGTAAGARPGQRVYNVVLRDRLHLGSVNFAGRVATEGGWASGRAELGYTWIQGQRRVNLAAKLRDDGVLLESERNVVQPNSLPLDAGRFRSLLPEAGRLDLSIAASDDLAPWLSISLNARLSATRRRAYLGPFASAGAGIRPLEQTANGRLLSTDLTINGTAGAWQIGLFTNYNHNRLTTSTDQTVSGELDSVRSRARSEAQSLGVQLSLLGPLLELPAGPLTINLEAGSTWDQIEGERRFGSAISRNETKLDSTSLTAAVDLPISSRSRGALAMLGDVSASAEISWQRVSDFGTFTNFRLSTLWRPWSWLSLNLSWIRSDSVPSVAVLDEPLIETPGVRYFDPARNETVDVTLTTGGAADLPRQSDETIRIGGSVTPVRSLALRLTSEYQDVRQRNVVSEFPAASTPILQAFPERFTRDGFGRLVAVDARPVAFPTRTERQIRTGFILDLPIGAGGGRSVDASDEEEDARDERPATPGRVRPRLQISAAHTWLLSSALIVRAGQPPIDLLSREGIGLGSLGQPRHRIDASIGYAEQGAGVRLSVQSRGPSTIEAGNGAAANVLRFEPLTTLALRAWIRGERLAPNSRILRGARITLTIFNVTAARERVTDRFGVTPLSYQMAYRDPIGRSVEIALRKTF